MRLWLHVDAQAREGRTATQLNINQLQVSSSIHDVMVLTCDRMINITLELNLRTSSQNEVGSPNLECTQKVVVGIMTSRLSSDAVTIGHNGRVTTKREGSP